MDAISAKVQYYGDVIPDVATGKCLCKSSSEERRAISLKRLLLIEKLCRQIVNGADEINAGRRHSSSARVSAVPQQGRSHHSPWQPYQMEQLQPPIDWLIDWVILETWASSTLFAGLLTSQKVNEEWGHWDIRGDLLLEVERQTHACTFSGCFQPVGDCSWKQSDVQVEDLLIKSDLT